MIPDLFVRLGMTEMPSNDVQRYYQLLLTGRLVPAGLGDAAYRRILEGGDIAAPAPAPAPVPAHAPMDIAAGAPEGDASSDEILCPVAPLMRAPIGCVDVAAAPAQPNSSSSSSSSGSSNGTDSEEIPRCGAASSCSVAARC